MSDDTTKDAIDSKGAAREAEARRDAQIEQLERTLADEREHSASLRSSVNELKFQMEILEKSYSKQLEDARARADAAGQQADEQQARLAELDGARQDAIQLLTEAKAEIDRLSNRQTQRNDPTAGRGELSDEGTINTLLDDAKWVRDREPDAAATQQAEAEARAAEEAAQEEMISPDLVFTARAADN
jgi:DNA repair exonuclease SbcCD ATPase subunit